MSLKLNQKTGSNKAVQRLREATAQVCMDLDVESVKLPTKLEQESKNLRRAKGVVPFSFPFPLPARLRPKSKRSGSQTGVIASCERPQQIRWCCIPESFFTASTSTILGGCPR